MLCLILIKGLVPTVKVINLQLLILTFKNHLINFYNLILI